MSKVDILVDGKSVYDFNTEKLEEACEKEEAKAEALQPLFNKRNLMAAFLGQDSDVTVLASQAVHYTEHDTNMDELNIIVGGCEHKELAMRTLISGTWVSKDKVRANIYVNYKNKTYKSTIDEALLKAAFAGNKLVVGVKQLVLGKNNVRYVVMCRNVTVPFPNDNGGSPYGYETHSAEDLGRLAFRGILDDVLLFATEIKG